MHKPIDMYVDSQRFNIDEKIIVIAGELRLNVTKEQRDGVKKKLMDPDEKWQVGFTSYKVACCCFL